VIYLLVNMRLISWWKTPRTEL